MNDHTPTTKGKLPERGDVNEKRIQLGLRLLDAAEVRTKQQQSDMKRLREEQLQMKQQIEQDVAKSLQEYDQWVGQIDERFTKRLHDLESRLADLQEKWHSAEGRIDGMMKRAEAVLDHGRTVVESAATASRQRTPTNADPAKAIGLKKSAGVGPTIEVASKPSVPPLPQDTKEDQRAASAEADGASPVLYSDILSRLRNQNEEDAA